MHGGLYLLVVLNNSMVQILKAKDTDQRATLYARALKAGKDMQATNRKLLLRMRLCVTPLT